MPRMKEDIVFNSEVKKLIKGVLSLSISDTKVDTKIINRVMGGFTEKVGIREEAELAANTFIYEVRKRVGKKSLIFYELADKNSEVHDFLKSTLGYPNKFPTGRDSYIEKFLEYVAFGAREVANKKR
jgi:hypothetical protein